MIREALSMWKLYKGVRFISSKESPGYDKVVWAAPLICDSRYYKTHGVLYAFAPNKRVYRPRFHFSRVINYQMIIGWKEWEMLR